MSGDVHYGETIISETPVHAEAAVEAPVESASDAVPPAPVADPAN